MTSRTLAAPAALLAMVAFPGLAASQSPPLKMVQRIELPGVRGRIDHLAADIDARRLFVAALGNGTLEVVDLRKGARARTVSGLEEPQGVAFLPELQRVVVATGGGAVFAYDGDSLRPAGRIDGLEDADNVRYDRAEKLLYVGYGTGALAVIEPKAMRRVADVKLSGHPESFQLQASGPLIYVNVPSSKDVAVVDRKRRTVQAEIPFGRYAANYPMALDEAEHRLFVATRSPARLVVVDAASHPLEDVPSVGDADDVFHDRERQRVYVTGGEGFLDVFDAKKGSRYQRLARLPTAKGARTSLLVPEWNRLYVAAPARGSVAAAVLVFEAQ
jgi:DNA-binding beta-propeller fold protein YncE